MPLPHASIFSLEPHTVYYAQSRPSHNIKSALPLKFLPAICQKAVSERTSPLLLISPSGLASTPDRFEISDCFRTYAVGLPNVEHLEQMSHYRA